jgi:hypothetical protein
MDFGPWGIGLFWYEDFWKMIFWLVLKLEISYRVMISWMILIYMWEIQFCKQLIGYMCEHSISRVNEFWPSLLLEVAFICNWSTYYWILVHNHIFVSTLRIRVVRIYFEYYQFWGTWCKFATNRVPEFEICTFRNVEGPVQNIGRHGTPTVCVHKIIQCKFWKHHLHLIF